MSETEAKVHSQPTPANTRFGDKYALALVEKWMDVIREIGNERAMAGKICEPCG
jgi:hypothetical protein